MLRPSDTDTQRLIQDMIRENRRAWCMLRLMIGASLLLYLGLTIGTWLPWVWGG